jgi:hypothetical protein
VVSRETWAEWLSRMISIAAAVTFLDQSMDVAGQQIDPRHQG